ncbi:hypothetical protein [Nostoc sp. CHAB 5836]|nr:hypothetical protein [Nostoc sp. CHAB 5836]
MSTTGVAGIPDLKTCLGCDVPDVTKKISDRFPLKKILSSL